MGDGPAGQAENIKTGKTAGRQNIQGPACPPSGQMQEKQTKGIDDKDEIMWKKVDTFVREHHMLQEGDSVLVGLSGGADSVCLLRYLLSVREKIHIKVYALHVNHLLRGEEAERDEQFAAGLCRDWEVPFAAVRRNVWEEKKNRGCSVEEAGRLVRYACFEEFAKKWNCNKTAVAHHKNDLAETMLFRMARGTGLRGLAAIRPVTGTIIRPLLCLERKEIRGILRNLGQDFVEDTSNQDDGYSRNYIRLRLLPEMEHLNAGAVEHLGQISRQAAAFMDYLEPVFQNIYEKNVIRQKDTCFLPVEKARNMHPVERHETLRRMLTDMAGHQKDLTATHVEQMASLVDKKAGRRRELPYGLVAERTREGILLLRREACQEAGRKKNEKKPAVRWVDMEALEKNNAWETDIDHKRKICFCLKQFHGGDIEKNDCVKYFDYDRIKSTLCIRSRQTGDYFVVDKEGRHKSLRRYFIDEKIPAEERDERLLLTEGSHVLWVLGGRISEAYKVRSDTGRILVVRAEDKSIQK